MFSADAAATVESHTEAEQERRVIALCFSMFCCWVWVWRCEGLCVFREAAFCVYLVFGWRRVGHELVDRRERGAFTGRAHTVWRAGVFVGRAGARSDGV